MSEYPKQQAHAFDDTAGYESEDVGAAVLVKFAIGLVVSVLLMMVIALVTYWLLIPNRPKMAESSLVTDPNDKGIKADRPFPLLQTDKTAYGDWVAYKQDQDRRLYEYETDASGRVRIPIDKAMELALKNGAINKNKGSSNQGGTGEGSAPAGNAPATVNPPAGSTTENSPAATRTPNDGQQGSGESSNTNQAQPQPTGTQPTPSTPTEGTSSAPTPH